jgi:hypothetical protein
MRTLREILNHFMAWHATSLSCKIMLLAEHLMSHSQPDSDFVREYIRECEKSMSHLIDCFELLEKRLAEKKSLDVELPLEMWAKELNIDKPQWGAN